jgi:ABC-type ATPase involved in cell division
MVHLSHIYKTYPGPVHALRDIDLKVGKGEFVFMTGPSGSGKTTIFRMICGFDRPTSGNINVMGYNIERLSDKETPMLRRKSEWSFKILNYFAVELFLKTSLSPSIL